MLKLSTSKDRALTEVNNDSPSHDIRCQTHHSHHAVSGVKRTRAQLRMIRAKMLKSIMALEMKLLRTR